MNIRSIVIILCLFYLIGLNLLVPTKFVFSQEHNNSAFTESQSLVRSNIKLSNENFIFERFQIENILSTMNQHPANYYQYEKDSLENQTDNNSSIKFFQIPLVHSNGKENEKNFSIGIGFPFQYLDDFAIEPNNSIFSGLKITDESLHRKYLNSINKTDHIRLYVNFEMRF